MPTRTGNVAWRGNVFQRGARALVDRVLPGNQRGADGTLTNVLGGTAGLAGQVGLNLLFPGAGNLAKPLITNVVNNGNPLNFDGNDTRVGQLVQAFQNRGQGVTPLPIEIPSGGYVNYSPSITPLGSVRVSQPHVDVPGFQRQTLQVPTANTQVRDITDIASLGPMGYRDASGNMHYTGGTSGGGWAAQAGGGASQGGGIGSGWTGISGDAARGMFAGLRGGSDAEMREAEMAAMRRMRQ